MGEHIGNAGGSAAREYERRRAAREARFRERFGRLGAVAAMLAGEPRSVVSWERGARGERFVGARLEELLAGTTVRLLHDRRVPGSRANIDHLAVGPAGVLVIDAKSLTGKVAIERRGLFGPRLLTVAGRDRTSLVEAVRRQVEVVGALLDETSYAGTPVRGSLCLARPDGLPLLSLLSLDGVQIGAARRIARHAAATGPLEPGQIASLQGELAAALPAA